MRAHLLILWVRVRDSLWFLPAGLTLVGAALALALIYLEQRSGFRWDGVGSVLLADGADGARGVLSAIASGLITVTGVVFSVTIVALQLASSQFTPRVLRNFTADRVNQIVLGVFIGTFTYTLLVLGVIRSPGPGEPGFVPQVAVAGGIVLVLISIGALIYFISHAAASMRIATILERVTRETLHHVALHFPELIGEPASAAEAPVVEQNGDGDHAVQATVAGYLQAVDPTSLFRLGHGRRLVIRMDCEMGQFVQCGQALARVRPSERVDAKVEAAVREAFVLGPERTPEQDIEFGLMEISDIAVKALSPAINDPTTALHCIDRLTQILLEFGRRAPPRDRRSDQGQVHFIARHLSFERAVGVAFDSVRHYGLDSPSIVKKLLVELTFLVAHLPRERHSPLRAQVEALTQEAAEAMRATAQRPRIDQLIAAFHRSVETPNRPR